MKKKTFALLSLLVTALCGFSQIEAGLNREDVPGVYFRTDVNDVDTQSTDVFILSSDGTATYLQGSFIITTTDPTNPEEFDQIAHGTWQFDPSNRRAILISTVGYSVPFLTSQDSTATRYAHRIVFNCDHAKTGFITDRQFITFTTGQLNAGTTAILLDPSQGTPAIPGGAHLAVPRKVTKYPKAKNLAVPDLLR